MTLNDVTMLTIHRANVFNYINLSQADSSGMLRFLTDELQDAEDQGDRGVSLATSWLTFTDPSISLDSRSRPQRLGWYEWARNIYEPL